MVDIDIPEYQHPYTPTRGITLNESLNIVLLCTIQFMRRIVQKSNTENYRLPSKLSM